MTSQGPPKKKMKAEEGERESEGDGKRVPDV